MGSPDPRDLAGPFRHEIRVEVRFSDTDGMRHVNNAKYLTYCEIARIRYWTDVTGERFALGTEGVESLILAEARITYRAQAFYGDTVTVQTRASRIGRSSFTLEHRLVASGASATEPHGAVGAGPRLVALSESVLVRFDYGEGRPVAISSAHVEAIEAFEGRQLRQPEVSAAT
jgi:acyl-CoA thioester hydrolase